MMEQNKDTAPASPAALTDAQIEEAVIEACHSDPLSSIPGEYRLTIDEIRNVFGLLAAQPAEPAPADRQGVALSEPAQVVVSRFVTDETSAYLDKLRFAASEAIRTFEDAGDAMSWSPTIDAIERLKGILHGGYEYHSDDAAVDAFAWAMRDKMEESREKGRSGWDSPFKCSPYRLAEMLIDHIAKGDPVDVGNFAMMLFNRPDARGVLAKVWESRASSSRAEVEIPEGYALVPKEPTDAMLDATRGRMSPGSWNNWGKKRHATIYRRMLAAAEAPNGEGK